MEKPAQPEAAIPVIESLGFGDDLQETMALSDGELDGLAQDFERFRVADEGSALPDSIPTVFRQGIS